MADQTTTITRGAPPVHVIDDLRGGRNGYDPPWAIRDNECADAVNVDFYQSRCGRKRGGCTAATATFSAGGPFNDITSLFRHVPSTDETAAELWGFDDSNPMVIGRSAAAATFAAPTLKDASTGGITDGAAVTAASINGKLLITYKTAVNRLHVWDGATVRRTGIAAPSVSTAADTGVGTYAATIRYYRNRSTVQSGGVTLRRSEYNASFAFMPSGTGTAARITLGAGSSEGDTHFEIEASTDNITFYRITTITVGTATYDDSAATTSYSSNPLSAVTGFYTLQKSYKFIAADQNRVLGFGSNTATDKQNRLEISAVIGSSDISDEERVDTSGTNYYLDFDENDSGPPTGIKGPIAGSFFVFKTRQVWQLTPTGNTAQPYRADAISKTFGAIHHKSIERGEDQQGNTALYWMSHRGPWRWTVQTGAEYIGHGIEDLILGPTDTIALAPSFTNGAVAHTLFYPDKRQVWFWWSSTLGSDAFPYNLAIYDIVTGGWSRVPNGDSLANCACSAIFSATRGASMSLDLKPYVSFVGTFVVGPKLRKADTGTDDAGGTFKAYVITKAFEPGGPGFYGDVGDSTLLAKAATGITITDTVTADFGLQTQTGTALLTASGAETRITKKLEGSALGGDVIFVQHQIGDAAAASNGWNLDRIVTPITRRGRTSQ